MAEFAELYCGFKSARVGKQTVLRERIPFYRVNGHMLVKSSDAEKWRNSKLQTPDTPDLKAMVRNISNAILAKRKQAG